VTSESGVWFGLAAFSERFRRCRRGYAIENLSGQLIVRLVDGSLLSEADASPSIFEGSWKAARDLEHRLNIGIS
jgi:hypothetical protein